MVIVDPEVASVELSECKYVIMACDGIFDCVSNEELVEWYSATIKEFNDATFT